MIASQQTHATTWAAHIGRTKETVPGSSPGQAIEKAAALACTGHGLRMQPHDLRRHCTRSAERRADLCTSSHRSRRKRAGSDSTRSSPTSLNSALAHITPVGTFVYNSPKKRCTASAYALHSYPSPSASRGRWERFARSPEGTSGIPAIGDAASTVRLFSG